MKRELQAGLFENIGQSKSLGQTPQFLHETSAESLGRVQWSQDDWNLEAATFKKDVTRLQSLYDSLAAKLELTEAKFESHFSDLSERLNKLAKYASQMGQNQNQLHREFEDKISIQATRQRDQSQMENKIQDMIDRHNQIVRNFENKLTSLTRIIAEQEQTLVHARSALLEARSKQ